MSPLLNQKRIFTFWEPREKVAPYLELCRETWERAVPDYEILDLDYSNLDEYIEEETLDFDALRQLDLPLQKDAVEAAVLNRHGGVFVDLDTLILDDISPIIEALARTEVVMFAQHIAFVASRPGAMLTTLWLDEVRRKLARIANGEDDPADARWDHLGNSILTDVHRRMIDRSILLRLIRKSPIGRRFWPSMSDHQKPQPKSSQSNQIYRPRKKSIIRSAARSLVYATHRKELIMLDRTKLGFIAESRYFEGVTISDVDQYRRFWLEDDINPSEVIRRGAIVVALHNSRTPDWYQKLSREEVLTHDCLLSRVLRQLMGGGTRTQILP